MKKYFTFFWKWNINIEKTNDSILIKTFIIKELDHGHRNVFIVCIYKPDIFSIGDIALLNSVKINYSVETLDEIKSISLKWEPYRSVSLLLWKSIENKIFKKRDNHIKDYPFRTRSGLEPARTLLLIGFKSNVSTNSTTRAKIRAKDGMNPRPHLGKVMPTKNYLQNWE